MNKIAFCFLVALTFVAFFACKKYPEKGFSFNVKKKLDGGFNYDYEKNWKLILFEVNGIDSTENFRNKKRTDIFNHYHVVISPDNRREKSFIIETLVTSFKMALSKSKTNMIISPSETTYSNAINCNSENYCERNIFMPYANPAQVFYWTISELTNEKLTISLEDKNKYRIILENADS